MAIARMLSRATKASVASISSGSSTSISTSTWKLPSPTWPTIGAISPCSAMSASVSMMHSASREIGTQTSVDRPLAPGLQRQRRPVGVVPRLPQLRRAPRRSVVHMERPAAILRGDLAERLGLLGDARLAAVEFDEQARRLRIVELRIVVHRPHLQRVDQFDARHRNAHLDRGDDRLAGRLDARERADAAGDRLRNAVQLQRQRGDDAERAFRADQAAASDRSRPSSSSRACPS